MKYSVLFMTLAGAVAGQNCDITNYLGCAGAIVSSIGICAGSAVGDRLGCACPLATSASNCWSSLCPVTTLDPQVESALAICAGTSTNAGNGASITPAPATTAAAKSTGAAGVLDIPHIAGGLMAVLGGAAAVL